jgi:hypothetical protein
MLFSALDQSLCWSSHEGWTGEFRKAWQQHCMDVNKRNQNERKATRLPHGISFTMKTNHNKKIMKAFIAEMLCEDVV